MSNIMGVKQIDNCSDTVITGDIIVVRESKGKLWFYGNYENDLSKADEVAKEVGGIVMCAMEVGLYET